VDSPPRPLVAKRPEEQVSIAHCFVGGSAWEPTPWRAVQHVVVGAWSGSALPSMQSAEAAHASIAVEAAISGRIPAREVR